MPSRVSFVILKSFPIFGLLICQISFGQNAISGKIKSYDNLPLQYANVYLKGNYSYTTSDKDGLFELNIHATGLVYDTLIISYVGLQTEKIPVDLTMTPLNLNTITLQRNVNNLPQFSVVSPPPVSTILRRLNRNTKDNYPDEAVQMDGFYRETMYENEHCIEVNEAIIQVDYSKYPMKSGLRKSFHSFWKNQSTSKSTGSFGNIFFYAQYFPIFISPKDHVYICESRVSTNHSKFGLKPSPYGGPVDLLALDKVKYQHNFLDKKIQSDYDFEYENNQIRDGVLCYVISFKPKEMKNNRVFHSYNKKMEFPVYSGQILVSADDYSLVAFCGQKAVSADFSVYNSKGRGLNYPDILEFCVNYSKTENEKYLISDLHVEQVINKTVNNKTVRYKMKKDLYVVQNDTIGKYDAKNEFINGYLVSMRSFGNDYNPEAWKRFESTKLFVPLTKKEIDDLQIQNSLEDQFLIQNIPLESLPKPKAERIIPNSENDTASYSELKARYDTIFADYIEKENEYYFSVLAKLSQYKRQFTRQYFSIYSDPDSTITSTENYLDFNGHKVLPIRDSKHQVIWLDFLSKDTLVNLSELSRGKSNFNVDDLKFQYKNFILGYEYEGRLTKSLLVSSIGGMDSLAGCTEYYWLNDSSFIYVHTDDSERPYQLRKRSYSKNSLPRDSAVFTLTDSLKELSLKITDSGAYFVLGIENKVESSVLIFTSDSLQLVVQTPELPLHQVQVNHFKNGQWVALVSNLNSYTIYMPNINDIGKLYSIQPIYTGKNYIDAFSLTQDYILFTEYHSGTYRLRMVNLADSKESTIEFPEAFCSLTIDSTSCWSNSVSVFSESRTMAGCEYRVDLQTSELDTLNFEQVTDKFESSNYKVEYREISTGEEDVPVLIMSNRKSAEAPLGMLVKSYGAYGSLNFPGFNPEDLVLMNSGVIVVWIFPRGSLEKGKQGYLDGRGLKKQNTFDDVAACISQLRKEFKLEPYQVAAEGLSSGGLIMGVLANRDTTNIGALILDRPFLNVLGTMMNTHLPLTNLEIGEWGNPINENHYQNILSYSPSQNIRDKGYPNMLFFGKYNDHLTPYWDIVTVVANYRNAATNSPLILMNIDMQAGHKGNVNYIVEIDNMADKFAFLMYSFNKENRL